MQSMLIKVSNGTEKFNGERNCCQQLEWNLVLYNRHHWGLWNCPLYGDALIRRLSNTGEEQVFVIEGCPLFRMPLIERCL